MSKLAERRADEAVDEIGRLGLLVSKKDYLEYLELVRDGLAGMIEAAKDERE